MNLFNPIKTKVYYTNSLINSIKGDNEERKIHKPTAYIEDEKLNFLINSSFVLFDNGVLKQLNILTNTGYKPEQRFFKSLNEEDIKIIKLSRYDKKFMGINYKYIIQSEFLAKFRIALFINLKWWEYWQIKIDRKDTYLHRIKLLDKIVFTLLGSIITILIGWLLSSW